MKIRIAGIENDSIVDGPGIRFALFVQGCPHRCRGCHNPQTWDFNEGNITDTDEIFSEIIKNPLLDGVTFSGGEPFCQCKPLIGLADRIKSFGGFRLDLMAYTGYEFEYLLENSTEENGYIALLSRLDRLVDGRFVESLKSYELKFMGSSNQRFIDVPKSLEASKIKGTPTVVLAKDPWEDIEIRLV